MIYNRNLVFHFKLIIAIQNIKVIFTFIYLNGQSLINKPIVQ